MGVLIALIILLILIVAITIGLVIFLVAKNKSEKKIREQNQAIERGRALDSMLANPYINGSGNEYGNGYGNAGMGNQVQSLSQRNRRLILSYCVNGRMFERTLRENEHITIGRVNYNHICIEDLTVSSKHCELYTAADSFYIRDLYSKNKTRVLRGGHIVVVDAANGMALVTGDKILVGNIELWVTIC